MWERGTDWFYDLEMEHPPFYSVPSGLNIFVAFFMLVFFFFFFSFLPNPCVRRTCMFFLFIDFQGWEGADVLHGASNTSGRRVVYALLVPQISARNLRRVWNGRTGTQSASMAGCWCDGKTAGKLCFPAGRRASIWRYCRARTGRCVGSPTQEAPSGREMSRRALCKSLRQAWRRRGGNLQPLGGLARGTGVEERANEPDLACRGKARRQERCKRKDNKIRMSRRTARPDILPMVQRKTHL